MGDIQTLERLKLAITYKQKAFVAHSSVQQLLASIWCVIMMMMVIEMMMMVMVIMMILMLIMMMMVIMKVIMLVFLLICGLYFCVDLG